MSKEHIKNSQNFEHTCELSTFLQGTRIFCFALEEGKIFKLPGNFLF